MWIWTSALFLLLLNRNRCVLSTLPNDNQLFEGSPCRLENDGGEGVCVKAIDCPARLEQISKGDYSAVGRCGFHDFDEIFCCAKNPPAEFRGRTRRAEAACEEHKRILNEINADGVFYTSVFNGVVANAGEFPHMAALGYPAPEEEAAGGVKYICGGTLISNKHVLTAAHCVSNIHDLIPVEVVLGANDLNKTNAAGALRIPISRIVKHPEYKRSLNYHDLAILELRDPVEFTIDVYPTCLMTKPLTRATVREDTSLVILGWGAIDLEGTTSTKLLKAEGLKIMNKKRCCKWYENVRNHIPYGLDNAMICVRDPDAERRADTCWGDSGGPLLISSAKFPLVIGITSFGQACGGTAPGVYVSVYRYLNWIEDQVWPSSY